jgi:hypothetical protein
MTDPTVGPDRPVGYASIAPTGWSDAVGPSLGSSDSTLFHPERLCADRRQLPLVGNDDRGPAGRWLLDCIDLHNFRNRTYMVPERSRR